MGKEERSKNLKTKRFHSFIHSFIHSLLQKPPFVRRHLPPYEVFSDECGQNNNFAFICDDCGEEKKHGI
jgi:hypothetical protein